MKLAKTGLILACALALSGCATLFTGSASEKLVVQYATLKVISSGKTTADRAQKAERIRTVAGEAKTMLDTNNVTLAFLESAVRARLATLKLDAADTLLANALTETIVAELAAKVGDGILPPDQLYKVSTVLSWVIDAASFPVS